jgi:hopanoid C-3 methylase
MRILLVHPPCGPRTIGMRHICRLEPLGLESIGAVVSLRHNVRLVDMMVRPADLMRTLRTFSPDVLGVTSEAARSVQAMGVLRTVRKLFPKCLNVVGGHHATIFPTEFDDPAVDLLVIGEGVAAFGQICAAVESGKRDFEHIAGLMIRTGDGLTATEPRAMPTTLDDQPFPDRSLTARYRKHYYYITEPSVAAMRTSMGCLFNCSFCPNPLYAPGCFVVRDPRRMFEEILTIPEPFIYFCDNGSFGDVERMRALGNMLMDGGIKKRYLTYLRADTIVNHPDLIELWARVGLSIAMIGMEALDDAALCRFNKGTDISHNEAAVRFLEKLGIGIIAGFVINPEDGPEDFRRLNDYIHGHPSIHHAEFTPLTPFPGTRYFDSQDDQVLTADWEVYDLMHFVVKTRLSHKQLYRMMVKSYRKIVVSVIRREKLWMPHRGLRRSMLKLMRGMAANWWSLMRAHKHVPQAADSEGLERLRRLSSRIAGPPLRPASIIQAGTSVT